MLMTQVYTLMNTIATELLGESVVVEEDLQNVVTLGDTFANVIGFDNYVRTLNDKVGRMVFNDRVYKGRVPSVLMDGWEFGSILEKISPELPDATENESWELTPGASYDPNIFYKPSVTVKCWNERVTFEIPVSITERQVKSSFQSPAQLNAFISMIYNAIQNAMTLRLDALVMRTINNLIAETVYADYGSGSQTSSSGIKAVNLLYLYNTNVNAGTDVTAAAALTDKDFIRFASMTMANYMDRMKVMSTLFNIGGKERFTPEDRLHVVMLSEFKNAANVYLQSDTFNEQYTALPNAETVPYWQGSGTDYSFTSTGKVDVISSANHNITISGILGVMFDREALGVTNMNPRVTTQYNAKAEFWNEWHKYDAGYFNDTNENMVVFFAA
jgi:hypothetical protein